MNLSEQKIVSSSDGTCIGITDKLQTEKDVGKKRKQAINELKQKAAKIIEKKSKETTNAEEKNKAASLIIGEKSKEIANGGGKNQVTRIDGEKSKASTRTEEKSKIVALEKEKSKEVTESQKKDKATSSRQEKSKAVPIIELEKSKGATDDKAKNTEANSSKSILPPVPSAVLITTFKQEKKEIPLIDLTLDEVEKAENFSDVDEDAELTANINQ